MRLKEWLIKNWLVSIILVAVTLQRLAPLITDNPNVAGNLGIAAGILGVIQILWWIIAAVFIVAEERLDEGKSRNNRRDGEDSPNRRE